jgi:hypothetical protein
MLTPHLYARACVTTVAAALLCACGGGSDPAADLSTSLDTATRYAANATEMGADAGASLDAAVLATQVVTLAQASAASAPGGLARALASPPQPGANVLVNCPAGGTALLTLSGGTPSSLINGTFDAGEIYDLTFTRCKTGSGSPTLDGVFGLTVVSSVGGGQTLSLTATGLAATMPNGSVTLTGSATLIQTTSTNASGATVTGGQISATSLTLATQFNGRTGSFTVGALDLTRTITSVNGAQVSAALRGTHTLTTTVAGVAVSFAVATQGSVSYSLAGQPVSGSWTLTLPRTLVGVTLGGGDAVITVDDGKDGIVDRTVTIPLGNLQSAIG